MIISRETGETDKMASGKDIEALEEGE